MSQTTPDPGPSRPESQADAPVWHTLGARETVEALGTDAAGGLGHAEAARRLVAIGRNELAESPPKPVWRMLWEQLSATLVVVLIVAAVMSALLGDTRDAIAILAVVVLNSGLGLVHEHRAERAMALLKRLSVPIVRLRRDGQVCDAPSMDVVPGDVVLLEAGNLVPADCRVIESASLRTQEAALTGESEPIEKVTGSVQGRGVPMGDRVNMVYLGTMVVHGRGAAVAVATGMRTELGNVAQLIQSVERDPTPLQRRLDQLGRYLALLALGLVALIFVEGILQGLGIRLMVLTAVSMAVAAVPEGLPAVVTIALALGAQRMLKRNALIRKLPAVESLGSVTVICSDKTGTLTRNLMTVTALEVVGQRIDLGEIVTDSAPDSGPVHAVASAPGPDEAMGLLLSGLVLCNDALLVPNAASAARFDATGDPTEGALVIAAAQLGIRKPDLDAAFSRVAEAPFDPDRKRMTTVHRLPGAESPEGAATGLSALTARLGHGSWLAFTKGALEPLLRISTGVWAEGRVAPISDAERARIIAAHDAHAADGVRVLALACRMHDTAPAPDPIALEQDLIFVGLAGMTDPPRPEAKDAVAVCLQAGIRPVMITGDHPLTARHVARQLGISDGGRVVTGQELTGLSDDALQDLAQRVGVFARVSPEHKLRIVRALQARHEVVAMTGDGVNDAPALRQADIGVAMGITGTDVAKEAADMVLRDDHFATIVAAVEEGRVIYDNIRKFILYLLASNTGELWVMILAPLLGMPLPLLPLQILWINLVTDGLPALALSIEPPEAHAMRRPPIPPTETILGRGLLAHIAWGGIVVGFTTLGMGLWYRTMGHAAWQTMTFTTLTLSQLMLVLTIRSSRDSFFTIGPFTNTPLLATVAVTFLLQMMVTYVPFWQDLLQTRALSADELCVSLGVSTVPFWAFEIQKWVARRGVARRRTGATA